MIRMKNNVYAVILAGGKGSRLWPLSKKGMSKCFIKIGSNKTLIEETSSRILQLFKPREVMFVVDSQQEKPLRKLVKKFPAKNILVEPFGRNTASAVGLAAIGLSPDSIVACFPSDSLIGDAKKYIQTVRSAVEFVSLNPDKMICVGVVPRNAATGYGYMKTARPLGSRIYTIDKFIEKPDQKTADKYCKDSRYLWNTGIYVFRVDTLLESFKKHSPGLYRELLRIKENKNVIQKAYTNMKSISIDYQIMEKAKNLYAIRGDFPWSDLGNWGSMSTFYKKDHNGNILVGKNKIVGAKNSTVLNFGGKVIGVVCAENIVVVSTEEGILVCSKDFVECVKEIGVL